MKNGSNYKSNKMKWYGLALMSFTTVWGFGNVVNGFSTYGGLRAVVPWALVLLLYFAPYSLMVGEMGSVFSKEGGGVSTWVNRTIGAKAAFLAGWTYWVVHVPYISQKPSTILVAGSWTIFGENKVEGLSMMALQLLSLVIFAAALLMASRGFSILNRMASIAGTAMFIMSMLFVVMMMAAPAICGDSVHLPDISWDTFKPDVNLSFFTNFSILIFAVGGCEKISPYVNRMQNPGTDFAKGMIGLTVMTAVCAVFGTIAMGMMFDSDNIPDDLIMNGAYYAFQQLGAYYHVGDFFLVVYAAANFLANMAVIIISIDAPLRMLLDNADPNLIPEGLTRQNDRGAYVNGLKLIGIIAGILIIVPAFGIGNVNQLFKWLVKLNSVCMPLRYLWVFAAYIGLKKMKNMDEGEYVFIRNRSLGKGVGLWCFIITALACLGGMYSDNVFEMFMNIVTPVVLMALGMVMPLVAKAGSSRKDS